LSHGILCRVVVFHPTRCALTCSGLAWYPAYGMGLWKAWQGTLCIDWDGGWIGKVPGDEIGYGSYPVYGMGLSMAWKGTSCTDWDCGWFRKVPGVRIRLWSVPGVRIGNVDGLERYFMYGMGLWIVWKGAQSMVWLMIVGMVLHRVYCLSKG
jgi:hypothetical protein